MARLSRDNLSWNSSNVISHCFRPLSDFMLSVVKNPCGSMKSQSLPVSLSTHNKDLPFDSSFNLFLEHIVKILGPNKALLLCKYKYSLCMVFSDEQVSLFSFSFR